MACSSVLSLDTFIKLFYRTGAKCLSSSQIPQCQGLVLHDSHAEILALRAFNHWLLKECESVLKIAKERVSRSGETPADGVQPNQASSRFLELRTIKPDSPSSRGMKQFFWPPFKLKDSVKIWMYSTCAPCGDASMELCMQAQEDPTPWASPSSNNDAAKSGTEDPKRLLDGRAHFSTLGAVRRKPSRADAQPTWSKSCSDKLAAKQVTSLLSFAANVLIASSPNLYISNLVLPEDEIIRTACERAFGSGPTGRMQELNGEQWVDPARMDGSYAYNPFKIRSLPMDQVNKLWKFGKARDTASKIKSGNISAIWTATSSCGEKPAYTSFNHGQSVSLGVFPTELTETIINGVKQGYHISSKDARKASALSRARMWDLLREVIQSLPPSNVAYDDEMDTHQLGERHEIIMLSEYDESVSQLKQLCLNAQTYSSLKESAIVSGFLHARQEAREDVRHILANWVENRGDEHWGLEVLAQSQANKKRNAEPKIS